MATRKNKNTLGQTLLKNRLATQMEVSTSMTLTENGQLAYGSTGSGLLNLFSVGGALRSRIQDVAGLFANAFAEDKLLALKMAFYFRDIRGKSSGLGERAFMKEVLKWMAYNEPAIMKKNLVFIPFYGRWDDLYALVGTPLEESAFEIMRNQWIEDIEDAIAGKPISLLAKWLKSTNTSSAESRKLGRLTAQYFGNDIPTYRKSLSALRSHLKVIEVLTSANRWEEIDFASVPSKAHMNYRHAFGRHAQERYEEYLNRVEKGEETIKASTLYPYDIFERMGFQIGGFQTYDKTLELQWYALPDYVGEGANILVMADTSGSMEGRPMCTSVGLATYFAERNTGIWKDIFLTFSESPTFVKLVGSTLKEKIRNVKGIIANTDLRRAFELVLSSAVKAKISADEMPKAIVVISDMEIDGGNTSWVSGVDTFHDEMVGKFSSHGYELPYVVYWNVDSRQNVFHATSSYTGVMMASGQSPSVFASIITNIGKSPMDAMLNVLSDERYAQITL
jgi:hypothetical protein